MIVYVLCVLKKSVSKRKVVLFSYKIYNLKKPKKTFFVGFLGGFFGFFWVGFLLPTLATGRGAQHQQQRGATAGDGGLQQRGQRYCGQPGAGATTATAVATTPAAYTYTRSVRCGTSTVPISVLRIHVILVWIRIRFRGSRPLNNGSGSGCCYFHH